MSAIVVDASIIAKVFFEETHSRECIALLKGPGPFLAPDLIFAEVASVIWKRANKKELSLPSAAAAIDTLLMMPLETSDIRLLTQDAARIALSSGRTVCDSLYLALAMQRRCTFITADERLVNALAKGPFAHAVAWIGAPA